MSYRKKRVNRWGDEGCTVTFRHRVTGEPYTVVSPGESKSLALWEACQHVDPQVWRIGTISTPQTIYDDLTFQRKLRDTRLGGGDRTTDPTKTGRDPSSLIGGVRHPEMHAAAYAGVGEWL